jgi:hypothetical protein
MQRPNLIGYGPLRHAPAQIKWGIALIRTFGFTRPTAKSAIHGAMYLSRSSLPPKYQGEPEVIQPIFVLQHASIYMNLLSP